VWAEISTLIAVLVAVTDRPSDWELHVARERARLAAVWLAKHPLQPLPDECDYPDATRAGLGELDRNPGNELVVASDSLGIAMFAESGELLAYTDWPGCRPHASRTFTSWFNSHWERADRPQLTVRRYDQGACGEVETAFLFERRGDRLVLVATSVEVSAGCDVTRPRTSPTP
jgi:hypothetical protein